MFTIGPYQFTNKLVLAPMAGVTDRPFRQLCRSLGAGMTVSEMISSKADLRHTRKSQLRMDHQGEPGPIIVQIAGAEAKTMADAAQYNVDQGAQIIDINMGCPAKKVCKLDAGSALLKDPGLVEQILTSVVNAVSVPVTLKTRTGWSIENKNILKIAEIAQNSGIQALSIHGRTRQDMYNGNAEYDTITEVCKIIDMPVLANGDIDSVQKAKLVMDKTGCSAIMIGRAAQKKPWIFQQIDHYFKTGKIAEEPTLQQKQNWLTSHLLNLYDFYGEVHGVKIARKHINWQLNDAPEYHLVKPEIMAVKQAEIQLKRINNYFERQIESSFAKAS